MSNAENNIVRILGEDGEEQYTMREFVKILKVRAGEGLVEIRAYDYPDVVFTVIQGSMPGRTTAVTFVNDKERAFWNAMEKWGWSSGQNPYTTGLRN